MKAKFNKYDFSKSLNRIDQILSTPSGCYEELSSLPDFNRMTYSNGFYLNVSSVFIDMRGSHTMTDYHQRPVLAKIYRAFISECVAIMQDIECCQEINIHGDCVWGVFNTSKRDEFDMMIHLSAKLNSLVNVLNYKLTVKGFCSIQAGIGLDFGRALMIKAGAEGSGINDVVWIGDVVNHAAHLSRYGNATRYDEPIMISKMIYESISEDFQKWFAWNSTHSCFHGNLINTKMQEWINLQKKG